MNSDQNSLERSELNRVIAPEITGDAFHELISQLAATEKLATVLEIGSSSGGGSTEAFVAGLSRNPGSPKLFCIEVSKPRFEKLKEAYKQYDFVHCYNGSTVRADQFPSASTVTAFYNDETSNLRKFPLSQVLGWLRQDIQYVREAGVESGMIEKIKADHGIETFDMVLIDGSEFTGAVEYSLIQGAGLILLDDTMTFKCHAVRRALLADPMYDLIADDQVLRNGYSVFRRRAAPRRTGDAMPIHFFTIVLNGEPFIRYHEGVFRRLTVPWHWHIVEGVAGLKGDTAWSVASGGHIPDSAHDRGRSNDGTTAYLDDVAARFPGQITLYRKPPDRFWDGKKEMVNAPLPAITEPCLLWQVDSDELWTLEQIQTVHDLFRRHPERTAAWYWCWYYVGPEKIISTRYNYAQNPEQEWLRTWRYQPGDVWAAHEPPTLVRPSGVRPSGVRPSGVRPSGSGPAARTNDVGRINPFTQDEMEAAKVAFHHFAYVTEAQAAFKEHYYGYKGARERWRALQGHRGSGALKDYFAWVTDNTVFDDADHYLIEPTARCDKASGRWTFAGAGASPGTAVRRPRIVIDGIFWQYLASGIGRLWENVLREWVASGFIDHVTLLDRSGTAPRIEGVHYWTIARHDYARTGGDSVYLESVCRRLDADLFVSTYYSLPTTTPSFFAGYDMIPEVLGFPLDDEAWNEKRRAILHASAHAMISMNSARDLESLYPSVAAGSTCVAYCGVDPIFTRPDQAEVDAFKQRHGLNGKRYVLMVGERRGFGGYKNGALVFRALAGMADGEALTLLCAGGQPDIEPELRELAPGLDVRRIAPGDLELRAAYAGAHALLYPSKYEGFGMPPLESMACGTPAIVCRNSSLPEVAGDAAIYVDADDPAEMIAAIRELHDPATRADLIARGSRQAVRFTFAGMAGQLANALVATHERLLAGTVARPGEVWSELRRLQQTCQAQPSGIGVTPAAADAGAAAPMVGLTSDVTLAEALRTIDAMRLSPFWKARELTIRVLREIGLRSRA